MWGKRGMSSATAGPTGKTYQDPILWGPYNLCWYHRGCRRVLQAQTPALHHSPSWCLPHCGSGSSLKAMVEGGGA